MFGKLFNRGSKAIKQLNNKDLFQATMAAGVLVAYADGNCSDTEVDGLLSLLEANPALEAFKPEIPALLNDYCKQMDVSFRAGKHNLMKEIKDCEHDADEGEQILIIALDVADIDGEVTDEEQKVISDIAEALGLNVADYE